MKTKFIVFLVLFSALFCSCTESNVPQNKSRRSANVISDPEQLFYENSRQYVTDKPELFGHNVLFFASPDEVMQELEILSSTDYIGMRDWQHQHNFYNPILNSIIVHDSVQTSALEMFGIHFAHDSSSPSILHDEDLDYAFEFYDQEMSNHFSEYVKTTIIDENVLLGPLGILDDAVFANDRGLYVCGGIIVKQLVDGVLCCPYDEYEHYESCTTAVQAKDVARIRNSGNVHVSSPSTNNQKMEDYFVSSSSDGKYILKVHVWLRVFSSPFRVFEQHEVRLSATNFRKKSNGQYREFAYETKIQADVRTGCTFIGDWTTSFNTGWCPMVGIPYLHTRCYAYCGCAHARLMRIYCNARNTKGCDIDEGRDY